MKTLLFAPLVICLITLSACLNAKKATKFPEKVTATSTIKEIIIINSFDKHNTSRNFTIESTSIMDNILEINVMFSGGCTQHDFMLYSTLQYQKLIPLKLALFLAHDSNGDVCRELIKETLYFNLEPTQHNQQKNIQLVINKEFQVNYLY